MKNLIILSILSCLYLPYLVSQNLISLESNGLSSFYNNLDDAYRNASAGDTIIIPAGIFTLTDTIDQEIHLIGVGHSPNSELNGSTRINSTFFLDLGADNSSFQGLSFLDVRLVKDPLISRDSIENILISRCAFSLLYLTTNTSINSSGIPEIDAKSWVVRESVMRNIFLLSTKGHLFSNNIITGYVRGRSSSIYNNRGTIFKNCIFLSSYTTLPPVGSFANFAVNFVSQVTFENNIFNRSFPVSIRDCVFSNNIFHTGASNTRFPYNTQGNTESGSLFSQVFETNFVNQSGTQYDYTQDYHLAPGSPGIGFGTDNTNAGVYGGFFPWEDSTHPDHPHFLKAVISPNTDAAGNLIIDIIVRSQN